MTKLTQYVFIPLLLFFVSLGFAQTVAPPTKLSHGTVNVVVANANGLVAVTDSTLTFLDRSHDRTATKLFQIDDRTICTVAGIYRAPGGLSAFDLRVPDIIDGFASNPPLSSTKLHDKLAALASTLKTALESNAVAADAAGLPSDRQQPLVITMAGYDPDGELQIGQLVLIFEVGAKQQTILLVASPSITHPTYKQPICELSGTISASDASVRSVRKSFLCQLAGITDVGEQILTEPARYARLNPDLNRFVEGIGNADPATASLDQLTDLARGVEKATESARLRNGMNDVGGDPQIATLHDGRVFFSPTARTNTGPPNRFSVTYIRDGDFRGSFVDSGRSTPPVTLAQDTKYSDFRQVIDGSILSQATFTNMQLVYNGSKPAFISADSKVSDIVLIVGPRVSDTDAYFLRLLSEFKWKAVIRWSQELKTGYKVALKDHDGRPLLPSEKLDGKSPSTTKPQP